MALVCKKCGCKIDDPKMERCPRCYSILNTPKKCEDCKGCGLFSKGCSIKE